MKNILGLLIVILSLSSCKKEHVTVDRNPLITEPIEPTIIASDTVIIGQWWGLNIGDTSTEIYNTIQQIQSEKHIYYLGVVGNVFTNIDELESAIPLYNSIFLDEINGSGSGVQIYFAHDKVNAIWTNNGNQLSSWPSNVATTATIEKDDTIENIYSKLLSIKQIPAFSNKLERISLFYKDINKAYDPEMSKSSQWHFSATVNDNRYYVIHLNFSFSHLISIYTTLYENH